METVLAYLSNGFIAGAVGLVIGVVFSKKIKDYITGAPAGFRTAMDGLEAHALQEIHNAILGVVAKYDPAKPAVTATVNPAEAPKA